MVVSVVGLLIQQSWWEHYRADKSLYQALLLISQKIRKWEEMLHFCYTHKISSLCICVWFHLFIYFLSSSSSSFFNFYICRMRRACVWVGCWSHTSFWNYDQVCGRKLLTLFVPLCGGKLVDCSCDEISETVLVLFPVLVFSFFFSSGSTKAFMKCSTTKTSSQVSDVLSVTPR